MKRVLTGYRRRSSIKLAKRFAGECPHNMFVADRLLILITPLGELEPATSKYNIVPENFSLFEEVQPSAYGEKTTPIGWEAENPWEDSDDWDPELTDEVDQDKELPAFNASNLDFLIKIYAEELNLSPSEAKEFAQLSISSKQYKPTRELLTHERLAIKIFKRHMSVDQIRNSHQLFQMNYIQALNRIGFLKDCGVRNISPIHVIQFKTIRRKTEKFLKATQLLSPETNVKDCLVNRATCLTDDEKQKLREQLDITNAPLGLMHEIFLNALSDKVDFFGKKITLKKLSSEFFELLHNLSDDERALIHSCNITPNSFAKVDPENFRKILSVIPSTFGKDALLFILRTRSFKTDVDNLVYNLSIFKDHLPLIMDNGIGRFCENLTFSVKLSDEFPPFQLYVDNFLSKILSKSKKDSLSLVRCFHLSV